MQPAVITVICGGQSTEHEVSIVSAQSVVRELQTSDRYVVSVVYIDHAGVWHRLASAARFVEVGATALMAMPETEPLYLLPGATVPLVGVKTGTHYVVDCFFSLLHGTFGEDGVTQGVFEALNVPYVGSAVLASAVTMHKGVTKTLLRAANIPVVDWVSLDQQARRPGLYAELARQFGSPLFVKPASLGSSVGVSRVSDEAQFEVALDVAFQQDVTVIIEPAVVARELECAVLGNESPQTACLGEVIVRSQHAFYSYEAKYMDPEGASTEVPAHVSPEIAEQMQAIAIRVMHVLGCSGLLRVDFFLTRTGQLFVNEANTLPGFTAISLYPKMWIASGLSYLALLDRLITLACERHQAQQALVRRYGALSQASSVHT